MGYQDIQLSRRAALQGFAGFVVAVQLPLGRKAMAQGAAGAPFEANAFIRIGADDVVTILSKHIEFGQGPWTGLATIAAEEMDADWTRVHVEHAPANAKLYANLQMGFQLTGGSSAIANSYDQMRKAGAAARLSLVRAAAATWGVAEGGITVENGVIAHAASGRSGRFGAFAAVAAKSNPVDPNAVTLKDPSTFRLIGKDRLFGRIDSPAKCDGTAKYAIDLQEEGLLTVVVAHSPRFGGKLTSVDDSAAKAVRGVKYIKTIPQGVAVYATGMWPALKARALLKIEWDDSAAEGRSSEAIVEDYRAKAKEAGAEVASEGDAEGALASADTVIEREFVFPFLAHAPMEPLDGYLKWDGARAQARFGCQSQTGDQMAIAQVLGLSPESVAIETMLAGGSFGRRAQQSGQFAAELAEVAKAAGQGQAVKLVWTREDDLRGGFYRPMYVHRLRGGIAGGKIVAWAGTIVGQSIMAGGPMASAAPDQTSHEGASEIPYDIPAFKVGLVTTDSPIPVLWWRSVGHTHTGYAVECFIDELLEATGQDAVQGRLALMGGRTRPAGVLKAVAELAKWTGADAGNGRMRGVAVVESFKSYVAQIAEVSLVDGRPKVHKVWCAVDCGVAVNPDVIRAQMEGGIGYALGAVLFSEITLKDGLVVQGNFNTYRSLRIDEMPEVEVTILASSEPPTGVGEPGVPCLGPAVANAMARLGAGRPTRLPFNAGVV